MKNSLKLGILLVGVSLFLWNCSKENINIPLSLQQQDSEIMTIQQKFSLENYQDSFIKNNLIVNWNNFVNSNSINAKTIKGNLDNDSPSKNSITYEFSTNIQSKINSTRDTTAFYSKVTLTASIDKMRDNISYKIIRYSSSENKNLKLINLNSLNDFTGSISFFDLNGKNLQMEAYKKGNLIQSIKDPSINSKNISYKVPDISGGDTGVWVMMTIFHYIDWYTNSLGGTTLYYSHSTLDNITHEWVFISTGSSYSSGNTYHDHFDNPHGPAPSTYNDNHPNEIIIDPSFENIDKINCTYEQLLKTTNFQQLLSSFFGSDAENNITFQVDSNLNCGNNGTPDSGCATLNPDGSVTIRIDQTYINNVQTPTLFIAKTLIHEAIHANLYMAVKALNNGIEPSSSDFSDLYEQYRELKNWQHEFMADRYINLISQSLQDIHPFLGDQGFINDRSNNYSGWNWNDFYTEIAWLGLYETSEGQKHIQDPNYTNNSNLYVIGTKVGSTKNPKCD